jgi:hypothetical protein
MFIFGLTSALITTYMIVYTIYRDFIKNRLFAKKVTENFSKNEMIILNKFIEDLKRNKEELQYKIDNLIIKNKKNNNTIKMLKRKLNKKNINVETSVVNSLINVN